MKSIKSILFFIILIFLFIPACEQTLNYFKIKKLNGSYQKTESPQFSFTQWVSGDFQKQMGQWQNENFGFRNLLVRLHNQIGFDFFKKSYANFVVVGKNNYLLDQSYIDAYTGRDFIGENSIKNKVKNFELFEHYLGEKNKKLVIVFAPGKASFYPEFILDKDLKNKSTTNHSIFLKHLAKTNINYVDFKTWFDTLKYTQTYTLFPKNGIHWSTYGAMLAADSLLKISSSILGYEISKPIIEKVEWKNDLADVDQDVGLGMNLLFGPKNDSMPYPKFSFSKTNETKKPKVLIVGDSYCWTLPLAEMKSNSFENLNFLYYNKELHPFGNAMIPIEKVNIMELLAQTDLVVLLSTDANLNEFDWNFTTNMISKFTSEKNEILKTTIINIKNDHNWFELIKQKAKDKQISIDSMLYLDAMYVLNLKNK